MNAIKQIAKKEYLVVVNKLKKCKNNWNVFLDKVWNDLDSGQGTQLMLQNKKICVIVPHIDDDILGMGGTLNYLDNANNDIMIIYTTDGRKSYHPQLSEEQMALEREKEAEKVKEMFHKVQIVFLRNKSMIWKPSDKYTEVLEHLRDFKPDAVFFPNIYDRNLDHVKNALCVSLCAQHLQADMQYFTYAVQTPMTESSATHIRFLSQEDLAQKEKCLSLYSSQYVMEKSFDKVIFYNELLGKRSGNVAAELFRELTLQEVLALNEQDEKYYHKEYPIFTYGCSVRKVIKANNRLQLAEGMKNDK